MKEKLFKCLLMILLTDISCVSIHAQITSKDIFGTWQWESANVAAGYIEHYCFNPDGSFYFATNEFDGTRRILSFGGTYEIKGNELCLRITYSNEIKGGNIDRDEIVGGCGWIINNGKIVKRKYKRPSVCHLSIERREHANEEGTKTCILIANQEFYKVEDTETGLYQ